jgi:ABC-type uncharacterized transport system substrate-binding protein
VASRRTRGAGDHPGDWLSERRVHDRRSGVSTGPSGVSTGLKETGLVERRDFAIEYRSTNGHNERLPAIVADVVARRVAVIVAVSDSFALAAKAATTAIPIVYIGGNDPVRIGLVASLNSPGGNVTGVTVLNVEIAAKRPAIAQ